MPPHDSCSAAAVVLGGVPWSVAGGQADRVCAGSGGGCVHTKGLVAHGAHLRISLHLHTPAAWRLMVFAVISACPCGHDFADLESGGHGVSDSELREPAEPA